MNKKLYNHAVRVKDMLARALYEKLQRGEKVFRPAGLELIPEIAKSISSGRSDIFFPEKYKWKNDRFECGGFVKTGEYEIAVMNPSGGGGLSTLIPFEELVPDHSDRFALLKLDDKRKSTLRAC